jgi:hypothetical protein
VFSNLDSKYLQNVSPEYTHSYALMYCTYSHKDENTVYFYHGSDIFFGPCTPSAEQKFRHTHMSLESSVEILMFCAPGIVI